MNIEKKLFYRMMSNYFAKERLEYDYSEYKEELEKIATANKCITLFCECSKYVGITPSEKIKKFTLQIVARNYKNLNVQSKLIKMLAENNIPSAVLKGASVALNYPEPMLRAYGDIDLLVPFEDYEKSIDLLVGENERDKLSAMHKFHYQMRIDNISVEIHNAVAHFLDEDEYIKKYMCEAINNLEMKTMDCFEFPVLTEAYQAPALLLHTKTHYFENELSFRMLADWALFVDKMSDDVWNNTVYPVLERLELNKFADAVNCVCKTYLDLAIENKIHTSFDSETIEQLANEFVSDSLEDEDDKHDKKSMLNIFRLLNDIAQRDFNITGKKKIFLPIFWVIILIRYLYRLKIGFRRRIDVLEYSNDYNVKEKIYKDIQKT